MLPRQHPLRTPLQLLNHEVGDFASMLTVGCVKGYDTPPVTTHGCGESNGSAIRRVVVTATLLEARPGQACPGSSIVLTWGCTGCLAGRSLQPA